MRKIDKALDKKKAVIMIAAAAICVAGMAVFGAKYFSVNSRNTRALERSLVQTEAEERGWVKELFDVDYDTLYVFAPYEDKSRMEDKIGFSTGIISSSISESQINYLFVKGKKAAGYLSGLPENIGYCINLQPGEYSREELEKMSYEVKTRGVGNSYGKEKTYQDYNFYYEDEIEKQKDSVIVQSTHAVTEVPVGDEITVDLDGSGVKTVKYAVAVKKTDDGTDKTEEQEAGAIDRYVSELTIDGADFTKQLSRLGVVLQAPGADCFYIVDLNASDAYKEIALYDEGEGGEPVTYFLRYQSSSLRLVGSITDNPVSDTCHFQNDGKEDGEIVACFKLSILQDWYAQGLWKLSKGGKLSYVPQAVYYPTGVCEAELLCELPVYRKTDREAEFFTVKPGKVTFTATDNKNWVQLETQDGISGWFYVENYDTIADVGKKAEEVFSFLTL